MKSQNSARRPTHRVQRLLGTGVGHLDNANYAQAASAAREILARDPNHLGGLELLARAQWRAGEFEFALDSLRHLIRLNPYEPGYHYMCAVALQSLGHYGEAVRAFGRCMESGASPLIETAAASIRDLEDWQESVIADLLRSDQGFQREYAADPMSACKNRGFAFAAEDSRLSLRLSAATEKPALMWDRPS